MPEWRAGGEFHDFAGKNYLLAKRSVEPTPAFLDWAREHLAKRKGLPGAEEIEDRFESDHGSALSDGIRPQGRDRCASIL